MCQVLKNIQNLYYFQKRESGENPERSGHCVQKGIRALSESQELAPAEEDEVSRES